MLYYNSNFRRRPVMVAALLLLASFPAAATVLTGTVRRPPAAKEAESPVERYRGRTSGQAAGGSVAACDPGRYAVVYLTADSLPPFVPPQVSPRMAQKDMTFVPPVLAVGLGTTVEFPNLDPYFHNVFSYSKPKKFDLGRYPQGTSEAVTFDKPGLIKVFCEIHYSMRAYVHVLATPYFCVSDEEGRFQIPDVRPGRYTVHVWQENLADLTLEFMVQGDSSHVEVE